MSPAASDRCGKSRLRQKMAYRRGGAALELIIVVGIEQIVFPVVLVMDNCFDAAQPLFEEAVLRASFRAGAIGIPAPCDIGAREVFVCLPAALID